MQPVKLGSCNQNQHIQGIVVFGQCAGNKAIVARIMHRRIKRTIQPEHAEFSVVLVLVGRVFRNLHDRPDEFGTIGTRIDVVKRMHLIRLTEAYLCKRYKRKSFIRRWRTSAAAEGQTAPG